jgi:hypothetical protein
MSRLGRPDKGQDKMTETAKDLFGSVKLPKWSATKEVARKLRQQRHDAAMADVPKALHALGLARMAAEPYADAFRLAHRELESAAANKAELTREELFAAYDRRLHAGHAWHPHREAVRDAERWLAALQKEIKECSP